MGLTSCPLAGPDGGTDVTCSPARDLPAAVHSEARRGNVFPLEQAAQAHQSLQDGAVGKVLIDVTA